MKISSGFFSYFVCLFLVVNLSQASENALILKYAHGNTSDKTYDKKESSFCVLNIHARSLSYEDYIEKIISINADVVCLPGIIDNDATFAIYQVLKNTYAHFYQIDLLSTSSIQNSLFVASNYNLDEFHFTMFSEEGQLIDQGCFDFAIMKNSDFLGHFYVSDLQSSNHSEQLLGKMEIDFRARDNENVPFFNSSGLVLGEKVQILTSPIKIAESKDQENIASATLITVTLCDAYQKFITDFNKMQWEQTSDLFCWGDGSKRIDYDVSVKKDIERFVNNEFNILTVKSLRDRSNARDSGGSYEVRVDISFGGTDGAQYDVSVKGETHDNKGNYVEGRADYNVNSGEGNVGLGGGNKNDKEK